MQDAPTEPTDLTDLTDLSDLTELIELTELTELTVRQEMTVACRTLAMQGYDDKLAGHVSVRDRDDGTLLVPRVGVFWDEIRPSDFVRIDSAGNIVEGEGQLNPTIVFHLELHKARPDIRCALHNHPPYGTAWACAGELPPLYDQTGANGGGKAAVYSEYEGVVQTTESAAALARAYGDADMAILTGHGTLVTASSVALALLRAMCFEHRARKAYEVRAMGLPGKPLEPEYEASASASADTYAAMLLHHYARRLAERDPGALGGSAGASLRYAQRSTGRTGGDGSRGDDS